MERLGRRWAGNAERLVKRKLDKAQAEDGGVSGGREGVGAKESNKRAKRGGTFDDDDGGEIVEKPQREKKSKKPTTKAKKGNRFGKTAVARAAEILR